MKERKNMLSMSKMKSRILAGFLAFVLVMSNVAANVQSVYAFGFQLGEDGSVTVLPDSQGEVLDDMAIGTLDEEKDYDLRVDIWPKMEKNEDAGDEDSDAEDAGEVWTGEWMQYRYDGKETDHTLGQVLLMSGKYADEYGELDPDLPGTWSGDNDDVMEVYPDGTALVKNEGYVNVTFTYEGEDVTADPVGGAADSETAATAPVENETAADDEVVVGEGETADAETAADSEVVAGDEQAAESETVAGDEQAAESETVAGEEQAAESETVAGDEQAAESDSAAEDEQTAGDEQIGETEETSENKETASVVETEAAATTEASTEAAENEEAGLGGEKETEAETSANGVEAIVGDEVPLIGVAPVEVSAEAGAEDNSAEEKETEAETSGETEAVVEDNGSEETEAQDAESEDLPGDNGMGETEQIPEVATGSNATAPQAPEEDQKKTLEPGTELTWVVCVKYVGPELITVYSEGTLKCDKNTYKSKAKDLTFSGGDKTVTVTGTWDGTITYTGTGTMTIVGGGTINASKNNRSAITVNGTGTVKLSDATVTGGKGTSICNEGMEPRGNHYFRVGGGVYVKKGKFELTENGKITRNTAQRGGGIYVDNGASFTMSGGIVSDNKTKDKTEGDNFAGEGGGIFVYGTATISGGEIKNNVCNSKTDLGGGGLYINNNGKATLINAKITDNTANGWGGGIAGCCHGEMSLVATDGAALYGNTALGQKHTIVDGKKGANGVAETIDHYKAATSQGINASNSMDFYTAGSVIISNYMAGGGSAKYTGRAGNKDVTIKDNQVIKYENTNVGLTANPTSESKGKVPAGVTISNNKSTVHGGGIGCNGGLYFGSKENTNIKIDILTLELEGKKELNSDQNLKPNQFEFELLYDDKKTVAAIAKNKANGDIKFKLDEYQDIADHLDKNYNQNGRKKITFYLREDIPSSESNIVYDKSLYKVVVILDVQTTTQTESLKHTTTNNNGFKEITVKYTMNKYTVYKKTITKVEDKDGKTVNETITDGIATFVNSKKATYVPKVKKTVEGPAPSGTTFQFNIAATNPNSGAKLGRASTTVTGNGTNQFGEITFEKPGTYTFNINEVKGSAEGYTYDESVWTLTVVVDNNYEITKHEYKKEGATANTEEASFKNTYTKPTAYAPKVTKSITGAKTPTNKPFTFTIDEKAGNPAGGAVLPAPSTATVTGEGFTNFGNITFKKAGTYQFEIRETQGIEPGYTYDGSVWTLTVAVADTNHELKVTQTSYSSDKGKSDDSGATFTNEYDITQKAYYNPQVKKEITGAQTPNDKVFTFKISSDSGAPLPSATEITVNGATTGQFGNIEYEKAGSYVYTITEVEGTVPGYSYDKSVWTLTVVVKDHDSILEVERHTYTKEGASSPEEATFTNTYTVKPVTYAPSVKKVITGLDSWKNNGQTEHTFTFEIKANDDYGVKVEMPTSDQTTVTIGNDGSGTDENTFGEITFNAAGTYTFTISEISEVPKGFTRDEKTWTLTVEVEDQDSELMITSTSYQREGEAVTDPNQATFTNTYSVTSTTTYAPKVTKQVIGEVLPDEKHFQFDLAALNDDAKNTDKVTMPSNLTVDIVGLKDWKVSDGQFGEITFKQAGEYEFTITEKNVVPDGYTYDPTVWTLKVTVIDDNSELKVEKVVYVERKSDGTTREHKDMDNRETVGKGVEAGFVNHYEVKPTTFAPRVMKAMGGDTLPPTDRTFTFTLEHGFWYPNGVLTDDGAVMPADPTAIVTGVGFGYFGEIKFTKAGTYNFTIKETDESGQGFLYDDTVWNLEVTIEDKDSQLTVTNVSYTKVSGGSTNNTGEELSGNPSEEGSNLYASFFNEYHVIPTETQIHVTKYVTGSVRPEVNVATFNFRMSLVGATATNGVELPENTMVSITGSGAPGKLGEADFGPIKFTKAGTYMFEIDEMTGFEEGTEKHTGYTYDTGTWKVTVEVADDGGTLIVKDKKYSCLENGELADMTDIPEEEGARFTNSYDVVDTTYAPKVSKEFARGSAPRPTEETFTFNLELPEGVDYGEAVEFEESEAARQVTVTGAGIASFAKITFHEAGTYKFIISEADEGKSGYTYDPTKWELTVEVVDRGDWEAEENTLIVNNVSYNQIETEGQTEELKSSAEMATFTNDYAAAEASYSPNVSKTITGEKRPIEKDFTFEIEAVENGYTPPAYALAMESGLVMPENTTATVTGEGTASFEAIKFTSAGTYKFVIHETDGKLPGYEYDSTEWNLTVVVVDKDGKLVVDSDSYTWSKGADAGYSSWGAAFTNDYQVKPADYAPSVKKTVLGNPLEEEQFNFTMESGEGNDADGFAFAEGDSGQHVTVNGAGTGSFGDITFKKAGTYTFKIKETSSNSPFWVDDDRTWTLTVVVEDQDAQLVVTSNTYARDGEDSVTSDTEAEFENEYHGPGDLSIEKTVSGNRGERTRAFNFTVTLTNLKGEPLTGTYEYVGESTIDGVEAAASGTVSGGTLTITLMHGQKITIKGVPSDTKYTVTEAEADTDSYQTTVEVNGTSQTDDVAVGSIVRDGVTEVVYENYRNRTTTPGGPGETPGGPGETPEGPGDNPGPEFELITDEPTPLGSFNGLENIDDGDVPLAFLAPMTGDNRPVGAAALFGLLALGMMGVFGILGFKKDEEDA